MDMEEEVEVDTAEVEVIAVDIALAEEEATEDPEEEGILLEAQDTPLETIAQVVDTVEVATILRLLPQGRVKKQL